MRLLERLYHATLFLPHRVKEIKTKERSTLLWDALALALFLLLINYSWNFAFIFEGFTRISPAAGGAEILYLLKQIAIQDLLPLLLLFGLFSFTTGIKSHNKNAELSIAVWTFPALLRTLMVGIPHLFPRLHWMTVGVLEMPQLVAYLSGLLNISLAISCCTKRGKKVEKKRRFWFHRYAAPLFGVVVLLLAGLMYYAPLFRSMPLFIKAPTFLLPSDKNGNCDLSRYRGKTVLLEFWSFSCPHCRAMATEMEQVADDLDPSEVAILAVHTRGGTKAAERVRSHMNHKNITHCYDDGSVSAAYRELPPYHRLRGVPHLMIVDKHGIIRHVARGKKDARLVKAALRRYVNR